MDEFEKRLDFDSDTFEDMKRDMNFILQRLIGTMQEKEASEGSMTLKLDVTMVREYIPNYDPDTKGESREVRKPQFKHKVTSAVKINDDKSGTFNNEMELVMDEDTGVFKLVPIANTAQRSIFDSDFQKNDEDCVNDDENDQNIIEGTYRPLLPGPEESDIEEEPADGDADQNAELESGNQELGEDLADITDELLGEEEPGDEGGDYHYEEPEDMDGE